MLLGDKLAYVGRRHGQVVHEEFLGMLKRVFPNLDVSKGIYMPVVLGIDLGNQAPTIARHHGISKTGTIDGKRG